jgi:hypothetical protein
MYIYTKGSISFIKESTYKPFSKAYLFVQYKEYISNNIFNTTTPFNNILFSTLWIKAISF